MQRLRWAWSCSSGDAKGQREKEGRLGEGNRGGPGQGDARGRPAAPLPHLPRVPHTLTDGCDELAEVREGEEGLRQLSKEELQGTSDNVDVFPAPVIQVETLI